MTRLLILTLVGNGFQRLPNLPKDIVRITDCNDLKLRSRFPQIEDDTNPNVDAESMDFIDSMHKNFELNNTMSMMSG
ncbi:hypothetical protein Hanom_Chr08g00683861 [Helianthus anomalus]